MRRQIGAQALGSCCKEEVPVSLCGMNTRGYNSQGHFLLRRELTAEIQMVLMVVKASGMDLGLKHVICQ